MQDTLTAVIRMHQIWSTFTSFVHSCFRWIVVYLLHLNISLPHLPHCCEANLGHREFRWLRNIHRLPLNARLQWYTTMNWTICQVNQFIIKHRQYKCEEMARLTVPNHVLFVCRNKYNCVTYCLGPVLKWPAERKAHKMRNGHKSVREKPYQANGDFAVNRCQVSALQFFVHQMVWTKHI